MVSALGINDSGQIAGECVIGGFAAACVVSSNGTVTQLGESVPPADSTQIACGEAVTVNNNGQVIGIIETTSTGGEQGWLWSNGTTTDLSFRPAAINDSGVIVGGPFVDSGGTVQNLNTLIPAGSGFQIVSATGINDNGQIVANATDTATGQTHALLLTPN